MNIYHIVFAIGVALSGVGCGELGGGSAGAGGGGAGGWSTNRECPPPPCAPGPTSTTAASSSTEGDPSGEPVSSAASGGSKPPITSVVPDQTVDTAQIVAWGRFQPDGGVGHFKVARNIESATILYDGTELAFVFSTPLSDDAYIVHSTTGNNGQHMAYVPVYTISKQTPTGFTVMVQNLRGDPISWYAATSTELGFAVIR